MENVVEQKQRVIHWGFIDRHGPSPPAARRKALTGYEANGFSYLKKIDRSSRIRPMRPNGRIGPHYDGAGLYVY
jgi:hypothetical protein